MIQLTKKLFSLLPDGDGWKLSVLLLFMVASAMLEILGIGLLPIFVAILANPDYVLNFPYLSEVFIRLSINDFGGLLYFGVIVLAVTFTVKNLFIILYRYLEAKYLWNRYKLISSKLFQEYMNAPYTYHLNKNSAIILRNITEEGRLLVQNVLSSILKLTMNLILATAIILLLMLADVLISLIIFVFIGGLGGVLVVASRNRLTKYGKRSNFARGEMIRNINEGIGGIKDIRVLKRESWFVSRFMNQVREYTNLQTKFNVVLYSNQPIMETFAVLGMLLIALLLYYQGAEIERMITIMTLFGAALVRMLPAIREIVRDVNNLSYYGYSINPIYDDFKSLEKLSTAETVTDFPDQSNEKQSNIKQPNTKQSNIKQPNAKQSNQDKSKPLQDSIEFQNVSYRYPNSEPDVLKSISFTISKGTLTGLAGGTGAGKTTLVDLLLGLLKPDEGSILFDGVDLESYLKNRTSPIGYIPQFIHLSDDTLERNIAYGLPDRLIDKELLNRAVDLAQLRKVVDQLPDGMQTVIGEKGIRFSGGQRQRIGIARALYHNPDLLIMDEATSSLDEETEAEIIRSIEALRGELTILMITHRSSSLKYCDSIIAIEEGKLHTYSSYDEYIVNASELKI